MTTPIPTEAEIRADERRRLAALITEHAATINGFAADRAAEMIGYLLTLDAGR